VESHRYRGSPIDLQGLYGLSSKVTARGEAVVYRYFYNGILVATGFVLLKNRVLVLLKTTYDEGHDLTEPFYARRS
jgi:hypothetical protein